MTMGLLSVLAISVVSESFAQCRAPDKKEQTIPMLSIQYTPLYKPPHWLFDSILVKETTTVYDGEGNIISKKVAKYYMYGNIKKETTIYYQNGDITSKKIVEYYEDGRLRKETTIHYEEGKTSETIINYEYGEYVKLPSEPTVDYQYDEKGRIKKEITTYENGEIISESTEYEYDEKGRLKKEIITHSENGEITSASITEYEYNEDRLGKKTIIHYKEGNISKSTTEYEYHQFGFLMKETTTQFENREICGPITDREYETLKKEMIIQGEEKDILSKSITEYERGTNMKVKRRTTTVYDKEGEIVRVEITEYDHFVPAAGFILVFIGISFTLCLFKKYKSILSIYREREPPNT